MTPTLKGLAWFARHCLEMDPIGTGGCLAGMLAPFEQIRNAIPGRRFRASVIQLEGLNKSIGRSFGGNRFRNCKADWTNC